VEGFQQCWVCLLAASRSEALTLLSGNRNHHDSHYALHKDKPLMLHWNGEVGISLGHEPFSYGES
jgi:hypothetical protein